MSSKAEPSKFDCYIKAEPGEEFFTLLGRDRHGAALVRLWALMREKEGEEAEVVTEARACADVMERQARERGKAVLTLDALLGLAASLRDLAQAPASTAPTAPAAPPPLKVGDIVVAHQGMPGKLEQLYGPDDSELMRGHANVRFPRAAGVTTIPVASLRLANWDEMQAYRDAGGQP